MDTKYDQSSYDAKAQEKWDSEGTYKAQSQSKKPLFTIDTPPPTVSGSLHIGHIFSYTQTDIIARYKRLSGFNVFYPFGFDNNGLATERFVEKKHNVTGYSMKRSDFIKLCLEQSAASEKEFTALWKRMGISADWSKTYSTISHATQKISQLSFLELYKKGHVYRKQEPALYCTTCCTSVAQAELDDSASATQFHTITFTTQDGEKLSVATTRPELLPSCVALFYHPDDKRFTHLYGKKVYSPYFKEEVPLLADEAVIPEKGTGLVMCCTFGDKTDIAWFKKYKFAYRQSINIDGKWNNLTGPLEGLRAQAAREKILGLLKESGELESSRPIEHSVNIHERCKKPIEYMVLNQWFLNILENKELFLREAEKIAWFPPFMQTRYKDWVEHLQWDWCLSRQRFYGIPFPVWYCNSCNETLLPQAQDLPIDPQEKNIFTICPHCNSTDMRPDTDVMDTWNTSSLTPYICAQLFYPESNDPIHDPLKNGFFPMSMRPQAHDIIRTWAFYTIIKTSLHNNVLPWDSIVISGHVLSSERDKISKSQGNNPLEPAQLLSQYPADAIRYWTASGTLGHDVAFSDNQLKIGLKLQTKLWNACRFIKEHISVNSVRPTELGDLNKWILHEATCAFQEYKKALDKNEFGQALAAAERFFWNDFCDNYVELVKNQLFEPEKYDADLVAATRYTLTDLAKRILQLFAPYMPHITETIYGILFNATGSLHTTLFHEWQKEEIHTEVLESVKKLIEATAEVRKIKTEHQLSLKVPLRSLHLCAESNTTLEQLKTHEQIIKGVTQAGTVTYSSNKNLQTALTKDGDLYDCVVVIKEENV